MSYLWDPNRMLLSRRVKKLSAKEECWYRRALDYSWIDEGIPADPADAAERIEKGCTPEAAKKLIEMFFVPHKKDASKVVNETQEERRTKLKQKLRKLSKAGKESARKRQEKKELPPQQDGNKCSTNDEQMSGNKGNVINVINKEEEKRETAPPLRDIQIGTALDGITKALGLTNLTPTQNHEWREHIAWAIDNEFTATEFVECFVWLDGQTTNTPKPLWVCERLPGFLKSRRKVQTLPSVEENLRIAAEQDKLRRPKQEAA